MLTEWMLRQEKQIPRRLLLVIATLLIVAMTAVLVLYGHNLFLRFLWEQVSITRLYYGTTKTKKQMVEFFVDRARALAEPISLEQPPPATLADKIATALEKPSPASITVFDASPTNNAFSLLMNRSLNAPEAREIGAIMAREAGFEKAFWGSEEAGKGRTNLILADGSIGMSIPARDPEAYSDESAFKEQFDFWVSMLKLFRERQLEVGSDSVWSFTFIDRATQKQVMSYVAPVHDADGHFIAVVTYTIPGDQLAGDFASDDGQVVPVGRQMIYYDSTGNLLYRGDGTTKYNLDGLEERVNRELGNISHGGVYWFEQGSLMIAGMSSRKGWRSVYVYPLSRAIYADRWSIAAALVSYFLGLLMIVWGVRIVRRRVLVPMQRNIERIEESERFNRTVLQIAPVGLRVVRASDGHLETENELAHRILPFDTRHEGRSWVESLPVDAPGRLQLRLPEGENGGRDVQIISEPARYQGDAVLLCAISDMTEEFDIRRTLQEARQAADLANQEKSMFLASMSHEIRTPLYGVIGTLELLALSDMTPAQRQDLENIQFSSRVLLQVLNDLLDYSKIDSGKITLESVPFDPIELVETAVRAQSPSVRRKSLSLACYLQPDLPWVEGDPIRIYQILDNLLNNALKFTDEGQVSVRMWSSHGASSPGKIRLHVEVSDTGVGISQETRQSLFKPFSQGEPPAGRRYGGTGLGLVICQQLAALMGGSISLQSSPGSGSRFTLTVELVRKLSRNRPGHMPSVAVLCDDIAWRCNLIELVEQAGGRAAPYLESIAAGNGVLLAATPQPYALPPGYAGYVRLLPDGPLRPERHLDAYVVNAYRQEAILEALSRAGGKTMDVPEAVAMKTLPQLGLRVLAAEDHPYNRQLIRLQLEQLGCSVRMAANGEEALSAMQKEEFDVLLTDVQMPVMDGEELVQRLRAEGHALPIIGLTASIPPDKAAHYLSLGMTKVLNKPILLASLAEELQAILLGAQPAIRVHMRQEKSGALTDAEINTLFSRTLRSDARLLLTSFERGELHRVQQLVHRMRGAAIHVEGSEEIALLCGEIEKELRASIDRVRVLLDDVVLYAKDFLDKNPIAEEKARE